MHRSRMGREGPTRPECINQVPDADVLSRDRTFARNDGAHLAGLVGNRGRDTATASPAVSSVVPTSPAIPSCQSSGKPSLTPANRSGENHQDVEPNFSWTSSDKQKLKEVSSEGSSIEIIVQRDDNPPTNRETSRRTLPISGNEQSGLKWDDSYLDLENYVNPAPTMNNLTKRRPQKDDSKPGDMSSGQPSPGLSLPYNERNFPPLPSSKPSTGPNQGKKVISHNLSSSGFPVLPSQSKIVTNNKERIVPSENTMVTKQNTSIATPDRFSTASPQHNTNEPTSQKAVKAEAMPVNPIPPHLRPVVKVEAAPSRSKVDESTKIRLLEMLKITGADSKSEIEKTLLPELVAAWDKAALRKTQAIVTMGPSEEMGSGEKMVPSETMGPNETVGPTENMGPTENKGPSETNGPSETMGLVENLGPDKKMEPHQQIRTLLTFENSKAHVCEASIPDTSVDVKSQCIATNTEPHQSFHSNEINTDQSERAARLRGKHGEAASRDLVSLAAAKRDEFLQAYAQRNPRIHKATSKGPSQKGVRPDQQKKMCNSTMPAPNVDRDIASNKNARHENLSHERELSHRQGSRTDPERLALTEQYAPSTQKDEFPTPPLVRTLKKGKFKAVDEEQGMHLWISDEQQHPLASWDNKFVPAPIGDEWTSRTPHDHSSPNHRVGIQTWANNQVAEESPVIDVNNPAFLTGEVIIGGDADLQFAIEQSLHDAIPARVTINDPKRLQSSEDAIKQHRARYGARLTSTQKLDKLMYYKEALKDVDKPNEYAPEANIYMRPAQTKDVPLITELHNHFIRNSVATPFTTPSTEQYWRDTLQDSLVERCPFIVAILSQSKKRVNRAHDIKQSKFETVAGFAYSTDFGAPDNAFRITLEMEIWVHPRYQRKGVGRTLLDRMLTALDPMYLFKDPVPFVYEGEPSKWIAGGHRTIQTLIWSMLYSDDEKAVMEKKKQWLMRNNFKVGGCLPAVAKKQKKPLNLCQMYYTTGRDISNIAL